MMKVLTLAIGLISLIACTPSNERASNQSTSSHIFEDL
jgi:hypothetical protein